ncbi:DsbA family protein [Aliiroseovarius subalbicans]|uniref:DsbA family protein n=1 Tax=Aliiroseovarius subalbicans TaxID=2925840 RepID=UPI001F5879FC|nr:DsbA family protein [Aliiroseovarius subalbicans]MCI2398068.1 DsbA family protein [Aliiroseovarius subalbicans]
MKRFGLALTVAAGLLAAPLAASDLTGLTDDERAAFRNEVRAYLLENPEVLMEAIEVLERRNAAEQVANDGALVAHNAEELFNDGFSHVTGNPDGDITMVEFVDYRCGYCRKAFPELKELIKTDGNIRVIYKEFPILGEESTLTSRFAISAQLLAGQEAYGQIHDAMMVMRGNATPETLVTLAGSLGLDGAAILDGMSNPRVDEIIGQNHLLAQRMQISGTPTFVMEDQLLRGYVPLDGMQQIVAELRAAKDG